MTNTNAANPATLAPKPKGPVHSNTQPVVVLTPTIAGFRFVQILGLVRMHRSRMVSGGMGKRATCAARLQACLKHPVHLLRVQTQTVDFLGSPVGIQTMTAPKGRIAPTSPATSATHDDQQAAPLDLHDLYRQYELCGYTSPITLHPSQAQSLASRLRGISAIGGLLTAATNTETLKLGDWLQFGLLDALRSLAFDAQNDLDAANDRAAKQEGAA